MMNAYHDNWERLVDAVLLRDHLRQLSFYDDSETPSSRSFDSDFTLSIASSSRIEESSFRTPNPSPLHQDSAKSKRNHQASKGRNKWRKGFSILSYFSLKNRKERQREPQWDMEQRAINLHSESDVSKELHERTEWAKRRTEVQRLQELYTLKGHIESVMKTKGLNLDSLSHYYTI